VNADGWLEGLGRRAPHRVRPPEVSSNPGRQHARPTRRRAVRRRRLRRPRPRLLIAIALALAVLAGAWLWGRDSSLVAVRRVTVTGASGPDAERIRSALMLAAHNMTTLDVKLGALNTAVAPYPVVKSLRVSTQFPHGMRIHVIEEIPVGQIVMGARTIAVASDATLLHDAGSLPQLPSIELRSLPGANRITDREGLEIVALLAAAPDQLLSHLSQASTSAAHGLVAQLRNGPSIYFGAPDRLQAKWIAASAVLADGGSNGAQYIDVTDPARPVAGASASSTSGAGTATGASTGAVSASPAAPATAGAPGG
jgi:cell division protein FtsQ